MKQRVPVVTRERRDRFLATIRYEAAVPSHATRCLTKVCPAGHLSYTVALVFLSTVRHFLQHWYKCVCLFSSKKLLAGQTYFSKIAVRVRASD